MLNKLFNKNNGLRRKVEKVVGTEIYRRAMSERIIKHCYPDIKDPRSIIDESIHKDLREHITDRFLYAENKVIPWIEECYDLGKKRVLEIGCGTGSMTVSYALRARQVFAIDVWDTIEVAKERARQFNLKNVEFCLQDSSWLNSKTSAKQFFDTIQEFDVVALDAVLEHLTIDERLNLLSTAWTHLKPGGIMVVYETPNRLSYFDSHTFLTHFLDALPDDLARHYAKAHSPRKDFLKDLDGPDGLHYLYRVGRGVSYHEFELAFDLSEALVINDGFSAYLRPKKEDPYYLVLNNIFEEKLPHIPKGFSQEWINLILKKRAPSA